MKITYIFCILVYILFFLRNRNFRKLPSELILFMVIAAPGISISGNLINPVDLIFPVFFVYLFFVKGKKIHVSLLDGAYLFYALTGLISLLVNVLTYSSALISFLQLIRLFYIPVGLLIFKESFDFRQKQEAIVSVNVYGIWLNIISIIAFIEQGTIYDSIQSMWFNGNEIQRAGGIFGESSYLGVVSLMLFVAGVYLFRNNIKSSQKTIGAVGAVLAVVCNMISYTRITNIAMLVCFVVFVFTMRSFVKKIAVIGILFIGLLVGVASSDFLRILIFDRLGSLTELFEDFNGVSSGRLEVWNEAIERYMQGSILFGSGYKNGFFGDNNLIMSLTQMGLLGVVSYVVLFVAFFVQSWNKRSAASWMLMISLIICSMTCDVLTYYRPMCLMLILYFLLPNKGTCFTPVRTSKQTVKEL